MARVRGMHGERLDAAVGRVESVVVRVLRAIAGRVARLVGGAPSAAALSDDDFQVIRRDWGEAVTADIVPAVADVYAESAETLAKGFADAGRPVEVLSLQAPAAADFLDAATNRLVGVADTLWEVARRELADGVRAGESIEELAARLQEAGGFGEARARMIARTECVAAANAASLAQALRLGDPSMVKEWLDSDDSRVREAHEFADGQRVLVGEPFEVGGEFLMYPGQPIGRADNVINERCTLGYSWDDADAPITAAAEVHTGAMVALRPSAADAERLAVEGGEPADQLHCTLAYLGEAADIPHEVQQALIDRLTALVEDAIRPDYDLPMVVEGFAIDVFNPPGVERGDGKQRDTCIVLGLSGGDLDAVHRLVAETVAEVFAEAGLSLPEQHAPWIPHSTLIYTDDVGLAPKLVDRAGPVTFDAIRIAFAGNNIDIPLTPVGPSVAAAEPATEPEHLAGVDLADSSIQVDAWADNTYSFTDPSGAGFWLDEDEANQLIDALNTVRSGGPATTIDVGAGGLEVALGDDDTVHLVPQDAARGWTLTDADAYDLGYWLAFWLQSAGYYTRHEEALSEDADSETLTAARRPWDPGKHPRGPDGRFIRKGLVPPKTGDGSAKSRATPRADAPARLPGRGAIEAPPAQSAPSPSLAPDPGTDPGTGTDAELGRLKVPQLRQLARDRGLNPGRARKAELVAMLSGTDGSNSEPDTDPDAARRAELMARKLPELKAEARERGITPGRSRKADLVEAIIEAERDAPGVDAAEPEPVEAPVPEAALAPANPVEAAKAAIRDAITGLQATPGAYVRIADVRAVLGDQFTRAQVDTALDDMFLDPDIAMLPEANQKILTQRDRDAAINIGAQDQHLIRFIPPREPSGDSSPPRAETGPVDRVPASQETAPPDSPQPARQRIETPVASGTVVDGPPLTGARLDQPLTENLWGDAAGPNLAVMFHDDGQIGQAIKSMGDDAFLDVDGRPLGDVLGMLATDAVVGRSTSQEVLDKLKILRDRLPADGRARRAVGLAVDMLDAPNTPIPEVPDGTPEPLRQLMADLHAVPLVRRDPSREEEPLADLLAEIASGRLRGRRLVAALLRLRNRRHESVEGKFEIDRAIDRAIAALQPANRVARPEGFASEDPMTESTAAPVGAAADSWDEYIATRITEFVGGDANLRSYWVRGEGAAKIRWGTDGDFDRCVRHLGKYVRDPKGLCAEYHHEAVGKWPGEKNNHTSLADEGPAVEVVEVLSEGPVDGTAPISFEPGEHWHAVANWEDVSTGLRVFLPDALDWRQPPFAFHWQWKSSAHGGTPETVHVGMTTRVERDALGRVHAWGNLDLEDEFGLRYARRLARGTERWVSIGLDESFKEYDIEYVYHQPDVVNLDDLTDGDLEVEEMRIGRGRIAELSGVSVPAQAEAVIEPSPLLLEEITALTAAATAADVVDVAAADGGSVTVAFDAGEMTHSATLPPEAAAALTSALRTPPDDGADITVADGLVNLSRDGDDYWLDLGTEAALLTADDLPELADAIDAATAVTAAAGGSYEEHEHPRGPGGRWVRKTSGAPGLTTTVPTSGGDVSVDALDDGTVAVRADNPDAPAGENQAEIAVTPGLGADLAAVLREDLADGDVVELADDDAAVEVSRDGSDYRVDIGGPAKTVLGPQDRGVVADVLDEAAVLAERGPTAGDGDQDPVVEERVGDMELVAYDDGGVDVTLDSGDGFGLNHDGLIPFAEALEEIANLGDGDRPFTTSAAGYDFHVDAVGDVDLEWGPEGARIGTALDPDYLPDFAEALRDLHAEFADIMEEDAVTTSATEPRREVARRRIIHPDTTVIVASGHTITIPNVPPAEWFTEPTDVTPEGAVTITDEGRLYGYLAPAGVAHRSFRNRRVEVPMGNVDYSRWMGGEAIVAGGGRVVAGPITFECGHCDPSGPRDSTKRMEHYDNTCSVAAKAAIGENKHGVWIAGALEPGVTAEQVSRMLACRLSGDWAPHPEKPGMREFVAALLVPVPGFAMGRRAPSKVKVQEGALVAAAVPVQFAATVEEEMVMEETAYVEGDTVRVVADDASGEVVAVHHGPVFAVRTVEGEAPRWYPAEELEAAPEPTAVDEVPVEELVASAGPDLRPVLDRVAKGIGRDRISRMETLRARVHNTN